MTEQRIIPFGKPWITDEDRNAVLDVLNGPVLTHGPRCREFEEGFSEMSGGECYSVSVSSGMAALHLTYLLLGIGPGDEVLVPAQTHTATAHAVELTGATPIFVDCNVNTGNMNGGLIESRITSKTKALSVVHFLGIPCDMDRIMEIAEKHSLKVVEDCALAVGARHKGIHVGLFGYAGCFSFYPAKHFTTGEGGMFVSRHREVAQAAARFRAFGVDRSHSERTIPGMYDVVSLGLNYRMSELQAALGSQQLLRLEEVLHRRKTNFNKLKRLLSSVKELSIIDADHTDAANSHYCLSVVLKGAIRPARDRIIQQLNRAGIGTSIYYPHPVPRLAYYKNKYGFRKSDFPHATEISDGSIALPIGPHVTESDLEYIACTLQNALKEGR